MEYRFAKSTSRMDTNRGIDSSDQSKHDPFNLMTGLFPETARQNHLRRT
jgi:hypothetical protein